MSINNYLLNRPFIVGLFKDTLALIYKTDNFKIKITV